MTLTINLLIISVPLLAFWLLVWIVSGNAKQIKANKAWLAGLPRFERNILKSK